MCEDVDSSSLLSAERTPNHQAVIPEATIDTAGNTVTVELTASYRL